MRFVLSPVNSSKGLLVVKMSENLTENHSCTSEQSSGEKTPKISVIVPVYKVEKYLPECIESVLAQTFTDFELILVDDGSPDNSGKICDDYAAGDSRIRVFHKENGGVTSARRLGVENAQGEWIMFVDSDDVLPLDAITFLCGRGDEYDIDLVEGDFSYLDEREKKVSLHKHKESLDVTGLVYARNVATHRMCWKTAPWGKIFRKTSLVISGGLNAPTWMTMGEDFFMLLCLSRVIRRSRRVFYDVYRYRRNPQGACNTFVLTVAYFEAWFREVEKIFLSQPNEWRSVLDIILCNRYGTLFLSARDFSLDDLFVKEIVSRVRQSGRKGGFSSFVCLKLSFVPQWAFKSVRLLVRGLICFLKTIKGSNLT